MTLDPTKQTLLEALELLAKAKNHVSRDISIGGQKCSTEITEFLGRNQQTFFQLQAEAVQVEKSEQLETGS